jgi:DHA1 family bicyclomycin/chloramphenicol resistance-like MFS transporter
VTVASRPLVAFLSVLTIFAPISMDIYLPVLPELTGDLSTSAASAQLTISACLIGLAVGQLVAGPMSDRYGRSRPLLLGLVAYVAVSALCAVSPSVEALVAARFVQGAAGGVGLVIAMAAGRDLLSGRQLLRFYGRLTVLAGLAAVVGPVLGGQLATVTDWRGIFAFLAAVGALILLACLVVFRETLPAERRVAGGMRQSARAARRLLSDRRFVGAALMTGFVNASLFAYLAGATFVLQDGYGLSPQGYAYAFGLNSAGFMVFGFLASRLSERWSEQGTLVAGLVMVAAGSSGVAATAMLGLPLPAIMASLLCLVSGVAVTTPPSTSLALTGYPDLAGTASSFLGVTRFAFGGLAAPLVGLGTSGGGALGAVTVAGAALAAVTYAVTFRSRPGPVEAGTTLPVQPSAGPLTASTAGARATRTAA